MSYKLEDVAKLANVSTTTVSRVINNRGYISEKTRHTVYESMKKLNYQPSIVARALQGKKLKLVGLIFAGLENPFIAEIVEKIETRLFTFGYKSIICNSLEDPKKEQKYLKLLQANQVDGIITGSHNEGIEEYKNNELPIISYDRYFNYPVPTVSSDNYAGGQLAANTLISKQASNLMVISGSIDKRSLNSNRVSGFIETAKRRFMTVNTLDIPFNSSLTNKRSLIKEHIKQKNINGLFCTDDLTAIIAMQEATKLNLKIPNDIQIIGYDGSNYVKEYSPKLSTIVQPIDEICNLLVKLLIDRINNKQVKQNYILPISLLQKDSLKK